MHKWHLLFLALWAGLVLSQTGSLQITPNAPTLFQETTYLVGYYTFHPLPATATILLDFSNSYITTPEGALTASATISEQAVSGATGSCSNSKCTLMLHNAASANTNIQITIGQLRNPYFLMQQNITTKVTFNSSYQEDSSWSIVSTLYSPMTITAHSLTQSNYGVGNTGVMYSFNFSLPMTPANPRLMLTVPSQVQVSGLQTSMSFYGSVQNMAPIFFNNVIIFQLITAAANTTDPNGFVLLNVSGLTNPQSMGNSSSFIIQLLEPTVPGSGATCPNCIVSQLSSGLQARSTVPGNIVTLNFASTDASINAHNNITVYSQLFASVPQGGRYQIMLPTSVQPVLPVICDNVYAFTLTGSTPQCSYDAATHAIYTENFVFSGSGSVVIKVGVVNPPDNRDAPFYFRTYDADKNMIGNSTSPYIMKATPLTLTGTATRNNSQVNAPLKLTVRLTLGVALTSQDFVKVILPEATYNTASISCLSSGVTLSCTSSVDAGSGQLTVTMPPPCSSCSVNSTLTFYIDGLTNPSFISTANQAITLQTASTQGTIQTAALTQTLSPATLTVSSYTRSGANLVGSTYDLSLTFTLPAYVSSKGGQLVISFADYDSYVDVTDDSGTSTYSYPTSLTVKDSNNNAYSNSISFHTAGTPRAIKQIVVQLCGSHSCGNVLTISGLRKSFKPLSGQSQTVSMRTTSAEQIATTTFAVNSYSTVASTGSLGISLSDSTTTQNSTYIFTFTSDKVPFQSGVVFTFPSQQLQGGCFATHNGTINTGLLSCHVNNDTSLTLTFTHDNTLMMLQTVTYTLTVTKVTNPISVAPLNYAIHTQFDSVDNLKFTASYAIQNALSLTLSYLKSNNTFAQAATLTLTVVSTYPTFNQVKISIPSEVLTVDSNNAYTSALVNNNYEVSGIYSLTSHATILSITNPTSTAVTGNTTLSMYNNGYLSAQGVVTIGQVDPVLLGMSTQVGSRVVGATTWFEVTIDRTHPFSSETNSVLSFTSALFDYSQATYNGASLTLPLSVPIGVTKINISNVQNILYIPSTTPSDAISTWTIDSNGHKVAQSSYSPTDLLPNQAATGVSFAFTRSNRAINGVGALTIAYTPRFPTSTAIMKLVMPSQQISIEGNTCTMTGASNGASACTVVSFNSTTMTLDFLNQTETTLASAKNLLPNTNKLEVLMYTSNNDLVETGSAEVTPAIEYNSLTVTGSVSTLIVASNAAVTLEVTSHHDVTSGSKIVIGVPSGVWSAVDQIVTKSCAVTQSAVTIGSCGWAMNGVWVQQLNATLTQAVTANSTIHIVLTVTNAWSAISLTGKALSFYVANPQDTYVSQGTLDFTTLYTSASLQAVSLGTISLTQTTPNANSANTLTVNFTLAVPLPTYALLHLTIPKDMYSFLTLNNSTSNYPLSTHSDNTTDYYLTLSPTCEATSPLCATAQHDYSLTLSLKNNPYTPIATHSLTAQITLDSVEVTTPTQAVLPVYQPQTLTGNTLTRSTLTAHSPTTLTLTLNTISLTAFTLTISPDSQGQALVMTPSLASNNGNTLTHAQNSTNYLTLTLTNYDSSKPIIITGDNPFFVPTTSPTYAVTIKDSSYIYYEATLAPAQTITPYSTGLSLERSNTTVAATTNVYLTGTLPVAISSMTVSFEGKAYPVSGTTFNVSLGTMTNPSNMTDSTQHSIVIQNSSYVGYNNQLTIGPSLTAQTLNSLISLTIPSSNSISQEVSVDLTLNSTSLREVDVTLPAFFSSLGQCCIDTTCTQTLISSCAYQTVGSNLKIALKLTQPTTVTEVSFKVTTLSYQKIFTNEAILVEAALPSSTVTVTKNITIAASNLTTSLFLTSWKVNQLNTYTLTVTPIARAGYIRVNIPQQLNDQLTASSPTATYALTSNGSPLAATLTASNGEGVLTAEVAATSDPIQLTLSNILNPINNQTHTFTIEQAQEQTFQHIFGYATTSYYMTQLDSVSVASATRNVTKIGSAVAVTLEITTPNYSGDMVISFPHSQVYTGSSCSVTSGGSTLPCTVLNSHMILTQNVAGTASYVVDGLFNQLSFDPTASAQTVNATIGHPYARAVTSAATSSSITPQLTLGSIILNSHSSMNLKMLETTTLAFSLTLQNHLAIDGIIFQFGKYNYIFPTTVQTQINGVKVNWQALSANRLYLPYTASQTTLTVEISNVVNYIQEAVFTIKSVKVTQQNGQNVYSDIDLYLSPTPTQSLTPSSLSLRVIMPYNHVAANRIFQVLIDNDLNSQVPTTQLRLNFSTTGCQHSSHLYSDTLHYNCSFPDSNTYTFTISLYHTTLPSITLATGTYSLFIYPAPSGSCSNQMCDSCSQADSRQYCFACRQGQYSANGNCQSSCQDGYFPYDDTQICQQCSPDCSSCFGQTDNQCLSCASHADVLSSGTCQGSCPFGTYQYLGYCVNSQECSSVQGCRLCSNSGFCYQCLPDYEGEPTCEYTSAIPPTFMVYFLAPFMLAGLVFILVGVFRCIGAESILSQTIFSVSFVELFAWGLTVPIMPNIPLSMTLLSFLTLRIIISIVGYEAVYKKNMGELSEKLLEDESQSEKGDKRSGNASSEEERERSDLDNWKTRLVRFMAHFNGPDTYELLKSHISPPVLSVTHSAPIQIIFMANRLVVGVIMVYLLTIADVGDSVLMPLFSILLGVIVSVCWLLKVDKLRACLNRCRT